MPKPRNDSDEKEFHAIANAGEFKGKTAPIMLSMFCHTAVGSCAPMATIFGALASQEVIKAVTNLYRPGCTYSPINTINSQLFFMTELSSQYIVKLNESDCAPVSYQASS